MSILLHEKQLMKSWIGMFPEIHQMCITYVLLFEHRDPTFNSFRDRFTRLLSIASSIRQLRVEKRYCTLVTYGQVDDKVSKFMTYKEVYIGIIQHL